MEKLNFPDSFLWGSAMSAYQVEGGIENNDWAQAAKPTMTVIANAMTVIVGRVLAAGRACDHYNRYEEDFDIAKSLGQNAHRFSIEWARVEPEEGRFDEDAIEHYRKVLMALRERGLEPFVTLWHFTLPIWFTQMGGFENKKAPFYFARYCEYVVGKIGEYAKFFITINEPMIHVGFGYVLGIWPPFKRNNFIKLLKVVDNLAVSHNMVYEKIKSLFPASSVGIASDQVYYHYNKNPITIFSSIFMNWFRNHRFLDKIKNQQDFIGVNYYHPIMYGGKLNFEKNDIMDWYIYPRGLYNVLMELKHYHKPVYITENGVADAQDRLRAKFIRDHLYWVHRAIHDGTDIRGYFYWSLLDNFEWDKGFEPRFGLVKIDYTTQERCVRSSAYEYKKICENNSLIIK